MPLFRTALIFINKMFHKKEGNTKPGRAWVYIPTGERAVHAKID